jgi:hypothetical protein
VQGDAQLLEVILTAHPPGRFAGGLDGGQEQGHEHTDDGNNDQQLDKRERLPAGRERGPLHKRRSTGTKRMTGKQARNKRLATRELGVFLNYSISNPIATFSCPECGFAVRA